MCLHIWSISDLKHFCRGARPEWVVPSLVVVLGDGGGGKLGKAGLASKVAGGHYAMCWPVAAGAVGSAPFRLSKDTAVSQRGLGHWGCRASLGPDSVALVLSLSWCVTFHKQALGFLLPSLDLVTFLLTFTWAWKCSRVPRPWLVPKSWISVLCSTGCEYLLTVNWGIVCLSVLWGFWHTLTNLM